MPLIESAMQAILFDLDGTLADTAPDLADALNRLRDEQGLPPLPYSALRPYTSQGARGLIGVGLQVTPANERFSALRARFLDLYEEVLGHRTTLFPGIDVLLAQIEASGRPWGIVTNKPHRFTEPLCNQLGFDKRAACIISGDTCARSKPAPDPLLHAAKLLRIDAGDCLYIGDDIRDIEAGKAAGMKTLAVRYGYAGDGPAIDSWGADAIADQADAIADYCRLLRAEDTEDKQAVAIRPL